MIPYNEFYVQIADFAEENGFNVVYYHPSTNSEEIYVIICIGEFPLLLRFFLDEYKMFAYNKQFRYKRLYKYESTFWHTEDELEYWKKWLLDKREEWKKYQLEEKMKRISKDFGRARKHEKSN